MNRIRMTSSILPKLLRNQAHSAKRVIPLLNKQILCEPPPLPTSPVLADLFDARNRPSQVPSLAQLETRNSSLSPCQFYPSFSAGLFLSPISSTGLFEHDNVDDGSGDSRTIRADSVKKKRKRKMNKHKLRKLRRRLRKKT